jgi:hypothetical protein
MHTMSSVLSVDGSRISGQDTVDLEIIDIFIRVLVHVVDISVLFIPHTDSLLLVSNSSSSASATTEILQP